MSNIKQFSTGLAIALCTVLGACATPQTGASLDHASSAIRAARIAGADTYAPREIEAADSHLQKAKVLIQNNRPNRAQKLLQLATAQADLAAAISEAEHAETALATLESN